MSTGNRSLVHQRSWDLTPSVALSPNRGVVYIKPGVVEVRDIPDPKFEDPHGRKINHAVILKIISTNICGCRRLPRHDGT